ncbi:sensor histidine kinase [Nannocystis radixulma]|uniref:histidine kinase n=1 Tax=Nannocystis radixulma TaxID=2995305 RepID=A0ABT5B523_9BACT|nr:HAMP domain-containing sensor histidine kinase [Nannocystis radixulma]MDC0669197.1 HAMP domain-containing sensor histidine kinase [Nannocystis radixulma]
MSTGSQQAHALAEQLERDRQVIIARWVERMRQRHVGRQPLPTLELVDSLPEFLARVAEALRLGLPSDEHDAEVTQPTAEVAREHGMHRYRHGFDVRAVVEEYTILLDVLLDYLAEQQYRLELPELRAILRMVSVGVAAAVDQLTAERDTAVQASHAELLQAREYERQLIGVVSHDLRNPLAIILNCAAIMMRGQGLSELSVRSLQRLRNNAERAVRLIGDLLDFTQERSLGRMPVRPADCDMQQLIREAIEEAALTHPGRTIDQSGEMGAIAGHWDRDRVAQVLTNLLDNALKFSPLDSRVSVDVDADEEQVTVAVHNWGAPIPPERLGSVFEAFQRADPTAPARVSLGLGLHISREIARSHGGSLDVDSAADRGTTLTLTLPRRPRGAGNAS